MSNAERLVKQITHMVRSDGTGRPPKSLKRLGKICTTSRPVVLAVSVRTLDAETPAGSKDIALRLLCRAMIRLYLRDCGDP
jgi:hypothetical protein